MVTTRGVLKSRPELFSSPWLVISVVVLIVNDWMLKPAFHNAVTGKLSDFAGLLALTIFACAVSERFRWWSASLISVSFIYWKSPHSQLVLAYLNEVLPVGIGRTPDYTDLVALPVVWIAAFCAPHLSAPAASAWVRFCLATLSFFALAATSSIPHYTVRESGDISVAARFGSANASQSLEQAVDRIATRHGLTCTVCDPISDGRVYKSSGTSLQLLARLDQINNQILYEVQSSDVGRGESGPRQVDAIRAQLLEEFRMVYPSISIATAGWSPERSVSLGVSKRNWLTSHRDPQNYGDIEAAKRVVAEAAESLGLKRYESLDIYYLGGLLGWPPYGRELVVYVGVADDPLVIITVSRLSDKYENLHERVVTEIERKLKEQFGPDRAGQRCWIFAC